MALNVGTVLTFFEGKAEGLFKTIDAIEARLEALTKKEFEVKVKINSNILDKEILAVLERIEKKINFLSDTVQKFSGVLGNLGIVVETKLGKPFDESISKMNLGVGKLVRGFVGFFALIGISVPGLIFSFKIVDSFLLGAGGKLAILTEVVNQFTLVIFPQVANLIASLTSTVVTNGGIIFGLLTSTTAVTATLGSRVAVLGVFFKSLAFTALPLFGLLPLFISSTVSGLKHIFFLGNNNKSIFASVVELVKLFNVGLTRSVFTTKKLALSLLGVGATFLSPAFSFLLAPTLINVFVRSAINGLQKIGDRISGSLGNGQARVRILLQDFRDLALRAKTSFGVTIDSSNRSIASIQKFGQQIKNVKFDNTNFDKLTALGNLKLTFPQQFQSFVLEFRPFLKEVVTALNKLVILIANIFGVSKRDLEIIDRAARKTTTDISKGAAESVRQFRQLAGISFGKIIGLGSTLKALLKLPIVAPFKILKSIFASKVAKGNSVLDGAALGKNISDIQLLKTQLDKLNTTELKKTSIDFLNLINENIKRLIGSTQKLGKQIEFTSLQSRQSIKKQIEMVELLKKKTVEPVKTTATKQASPIPEKQIQKDLVLVGGGIDRLGIDIDKFINKMRIKFSEAQKVVKDFSNAQNQVVSNGKSLVSSFQSQMEILTKFALKIFDVKLLLENATAPRKGGRQGAQANNEVLPGIFPKEFSAALMNFINAVHQFSQELAKDEKTIAKTLITLVNSFNFLAARIHQAETLITVDIKALESIKLNAAIIKTNIITPIEKVILEARKNFEVVGVTLGGQFSSVLAGSIRNVSGLDVKSAVFGIVNLISFILSTSDFAKQGKAMIVTFASGITSETPLLKEVITALLNKAAKPLLPESDAPEGPLSRLTKSGEAIPKTLAEGVQKGQGKLRQAIKAMLSFVVSEFEKNAKQLFDRSKQLATFVTGNLSSILSTPGRSTQEFAQGARDLKLLSERLNIDITTLSQLDFAAKQFGVTVQDLSFGFKTLKKNLNEAISNEETNKSFQDLGINVADVLSTANPLITAYKKLSEVVRNNADDTDKQSKALELLGIIGDSNLINLVKTGAAFEEVGKEGSQLGVVLSENLAKISEDLILVQNKFELLGKFLLAEFLLPLLPMLIQFGNDILEFIKTNRVNISALISFVVSVLNIVRKGFHDFIVFVVSEPGKAFVIIKNVMTELFTFSLDILASLGNIALIKINGIISSITSEIDQKTKIFMSELFTGVLSGLDSLLKRVLLFLANAFRSIGSFLLSGLKKILPEGALDNLFPSTKKIEIFKESLQDFETFNKIKNEGQFGVNVLSNQEADAVTQRLKDLKDRVRELDKAGKINIDIDNSLFSVGAVNDALRIASEDLNNDLTKDLEVSLKEREKLTRKFFDNSFGVGNQQQQTQALDDQKRATDEQVTALKDRLTALGESFTGLGKDNQLGKFVDDLKKKLTLEGFSEEVEKNAAKLEAALKKPAENAEKNLENQKITARDFSETIIGDMRKATKEVQDGFTQIDLTGFTKSFQDIFGGTASTFLPATLTDVGKKLLEIDEKAQAFKNRIQQFNEPLSKTPELLAAINAQAEITLATFENQKKAIKFNEFLENNSEALSLIKSSQEDGLRAGQKLTKEFNLQVESLEKLKTNFAQVAGSQAEIAAFNGEVNAAIDALEFRLAGQMNAVAIDSLTSAFETSLKTFIEKGKLTFEDLASIAKDVFSANFQTVIDGVKTGLTTALTSVFQKLGATSELGGLAVSGILAVGSLLLTRLKGQAEVVNNTIEDTVERVEQVRGVIAGERQIGIQEVADRLINVNKPIVDELRGIKEILVQIRDRGGIGTSELLQGNFS